MRVRRLVSVLSVCAVSSLAVIATAQPKKPAPAPTPAEGSAPDGSAGSAEPVDEPPKDIEGRDENPGARTLGEEEKPAVVTTVAPVRTGYPVEEALRPINVPKGMAEISIGPHATVDPYEFTDALRARYGITNKVQIGLTYVLGGVYDDPATMDTDALGVHSGKAVGLDVTYLLAPWVGLRLGVPFYIKPVAASIAVGAPMKFVLNDKLAIGGLDDVLNIAINDKFAPSFYNEAQNARGAEREDSNTAQSNGEFRISGFVNYNFQPKLAFIGRTGFRLEDFSTSKSEAGGLFYFLRAGLNYTPKKYLDVGLSLGFEDLGELGSFSPAGFLAFRID